MKVFISILAAVLIILFSLLIMGAIKESKDCKENDGEMKGSGEYTTTFIPSGNVIVPIVTENQKCSK